MNNNDFCTEFTSLKKIETATGNSVVFAITLSSSIDDLQLSVSFTAVLVNKYPVGRRFYSILYDYKEGGAIEALNEIKHEDESYDCHYDGKQCIEIPKKNVFYFEDTDSSVSIISTCGDGIVATVSIIESNDECLVFSIDRFDNPNVVSLKCIANKSTAITVGEYSIPTVVTETN